MNVSPPVPAPQVSGPQSSVLAAWGAGTENELAEVWEVSTPVLRRRPGDVPQKRKRGRRRSKRPVMDDAPANSGSTTPTANGGVSLPQGFSRLSECREEGR